MEIIDSGVERFVVGLIVKQIRFGNPTSRFRTIYVFAGIVNDLRVRSLFWQIRLTAHRCLDCFPLKNRCVFFYRVLLYFGGDLLFLSKDYSC